MRNKNNDEVRYQAWPNAIGIKKKNRRIILVDRPYEPDAFNIELKIFDKGFIGSKLKSSESCVKKGILTTIIPMSDETMEYLIWLYDERKKRKLAEIKTDLNEIKLDIKTKYTKNLKRSFSMAQILFIKEMITNGFIILEYINLDTNSSDITLTDKDKGNIYLINIRTFKALNKLQVFDIKKVYSTMNPNTETIEYSLKESVKNLFK